MGHRVDDKFQALRDQGFTGAISDMTLQWLKVNGATSDAIPDAWQEMLAIQLGDLATGDRNTDFYLLLGQLGFTGAYPDRVAQFWESGGELVTLLFQASLTQSLIPERSVGSPLPTYNRTGIATHRQPVTLRKVTLPADVPRMAGNRLVYNILAEGPGASEFPTSESSNPLILPSVTGGTFAWGQPDMDGDPNALHYDVPDGSSATLSLKLPAGEGLNFTKLCRISIWIKPIALGPDVDFALRHGVFNSTFTFSPEDLAIGEWQRVSYDAPESLADDPFAGGGDNLLFFSKLAAGGDSSAEFLIARAQVEYQSWDTDIGDYVSVGQLTDPFHGAGLDGYKYFPYYNGYFTSPNGVVVEPSSAASLAGTINVGYKSGGAGIDSWGWNRWENYGDADPNPIYLKGLEVRTIGEDLLIANYFFRVVIHNPADAPDTLLPQNFFDSITIKGVTLNTAEADSFAVNSRNDASVWTWIVAQLSSSPIDLADDVGNDVAWTIVADTFQEALVTANHPQDTDSNEPFGYLAEDDQENLILNSRDMNGAAWANTWGGGVDPTDRWS
jgi:hypothetical protein